MFTIVVTGSRGWSSWKVIEEALTEFVALYGSDGVKVIHGDARGADKMSAWTARNKLGIPATNVVACPADWEKYGRGAGFKRNAEMLAMLKREVDAENGEGGTVVAFWDGQSKGTKHTIDCAKEMALPLKVYSTQVVVTAS